MSNNNILIPNPERLAQIKKAITNGRPEKIHILSDFDRTLTTAFVDGKPVPSLVSLLRDGHYLTPDYAPQSQTLYNKYHPIEIDPNIPLTEKKKVMKEWWETHFDLLIKSGLNKKDLAKAVQSGVVKFRTGVFEFLDFLHQYQIPLVIMSSSGLGGDTVSQYLQNAGKLYDNIYIIGNSFDWDNNGYAMAVKKPIIHSMNKDETIVRDFPVFEKIKERKNVILLADNLEEVGMIERFEYDNLIKIGFLNEKIEENLEPFKKNYDVVILNDGSFEFVNEMMNEIIKGGY